MIMTCINSKVALPIDTPIRFQTFFSLNNVYLDVLYKVLVSIFNIIERIYS